MITKINSDLRGLTDWLNANRISLNSGKTEYVLFRHPNKIVNLDIKIKLNGKRLFPSKFIRYLGILVDENLTWKFHIHELNKKLSRANSMLCKIRYFVDSKTLRSIYYAIFSSHLTYCSHIWGQKGNPAVLKVESLQRKAIRIINFAPFRCKTSDLFSKSEILTFSDHMLFTNCLFIFDQFKYNIPDPLSNFFVTTNNLYSHETKSSKLGKLFQNHVHNRYGKFSIRNQCISDWNTHIQEINHLLNAQYISKNEATPEIKQLSRMQFKNLILEYLC